VLAPVASEGADIGLLPVALIPAGVPGLPPNARSSTEESSPPLPCDFCSSSSGSRVRRWRWHGENPHTCHPCRKPFLECAEGASEHGPYPRQRCKCPSGRGNIGPGALFLLEVLRVDYRARLRRTRRERWNQLVGGHSLDGSDEQHPSPPNLPASHPARASPCTVLTTSFSAAASRDGRSFFALPIPYQLPPRHRDPLLPPTF
jgi:hypothetical protein